MKPEIPYRAAGTFIGEAYVERKADRLLKREIRGNQRFPYVVAARQSGKSSLLVRTLESLDSTEYRGALVDLSPLSLDDYEGFWRRFLLEVAKSARLSQNVIDPSEPEETFRAWLTETNERLVVFVDEIDALIVAPFRDLFFSKVRSLFNQRARDKELRRLQFVLAGAAHPSRLIQDQMRSPFNVGVEIALDELTLEHVRALASHLQSAGKEISGDIGEAIHSLTSGLPFLCQLLCEKLFVLADELPRIGLADVEAVAASVVEEAPRDIHFTNIYELIANNRQLLEVFGKVWRGEIISERARQDLRLTGISDGKTPYRNEIYRRVFSAGGPLDLESLLRMTVTSLMPAPPPPMPSEESREFEMAGAGPDEDVAVSPAEEEKWAQFEPGRAGESDTPKYPDLETRALAEQIESAIARRDAMRSVGASTEGVEREIMNLRLHLRKGGKLRAGDALGDNRYLLLEQIGGGIASAVWRALDRKTGQIVATKVLHTSVSADATQLEQFFRGARAMASLSHPAIVRVLEPRGEDFGFHYFVMEHVPGRNLAAIMKEGPIPSERLLPIALTVGDALAEVHEKGWIHRDVSPSNILVADSGEARLTDFDVSIDGATRDGSRVVALGEFLYLAPELFANAEAITPAVDVFALGMLVMQGLSGREFQVDALFSPPSLRAGLPIASPVERALERAIARDPKDRYPNAAAFCEALRQARAGGRVAPLDKDEATPKAAEKQKAPAPVNTIPAASPGPGLPDHLTVGAPPLPDERPAFSPAIRLAILGSLFGIALVVLYVATKDIGKGDPGGGERPVQSGMAAASAAPIVSAEPSALAERKDPIPPPLDDPQGIHKQPTKVYQTTSATPAGSTASTISSVAIANGSPTGTGRTADPLGPQFTDDPLDVHPPSNVAKDPQGKAAGTPCPVEMIAIGGLDSLCLGKAEVSVADYRKCIAAKACAPPTGASCKMPPGNEQGDQPMLCATFNDAARYCAWAGKQSSYQEEWGAVMSNVRARQTQSGDGGAKAVGFRCAR